jgi:hypothetical protein
VDFSEPLTLCTVLYSKDFPSGNSCLNSRTDRANTSEILLEQQKKWIRKESEKLSFVKIKEMEPPLPH